MIANLYTVSVSIPVFYEFKQAFVASMAELGHTVNIFEYEYYSYKTKSPAADINFIIVGSLKCLIPFLTNNPKINNSYKVLLWFEQWAESNKQLNIRKLFNCTIDIFESNYNIYKNKTKSIYCPLGWSKSYETDIISTNIDEVINCYTFGALTITRQEFMSKNKKDVVFQLAVFGKKRDINIISSKINLIIPATPGYYFPQLRYLLIACKKKFVLSSPHINYAPFIPNKHFKVFNSFKKDYTYWINAVNERHIFAQEVYEDLKSNYNYTLFLKEALKKL